MNAGKSMLKSLQKKLDLALKAGMQDEIINASNELIVFHQQQGDFAQCISYSKSIQSYYTMPDKQHELAHSH